jgi:hypothetical protein
MVRFQTMSKLDKMKTHEAANKQKENIHYTNN